MDNNLYIIENLSCSYTDKLDEKVLHIDRLEIPRDKLVFLLGASGCGKSTLLETLGLMNNTIAAGKISFLPLFGKEAVDLSALWQSHNERKLNEIRKLYYSFIFQNTNLMENFTAYENVCLSGMIKENVKQKEVLQGARELMDRVKLPESEVDLSTLGSNLSGGQRQRLAFVRALNNNATVLFGDEPTGNLDETNANELFEIIKSNLGKGLSAIVVSHDINLAVKHADKIIVITKNPGKGYGEVSPELIFDKAQWENYSETELNVFKQQLKSYYHAANEHLAQSQDKNVAIDTSVNYTKLFFKKEGATLFGKKRVNLFILTLILFFTFLAIGFANGGLYYLQTVLNSAFVNWVTVTVPSSRSDRKQINDLLTGIKEPAVKNKYFIGDVTTYSESALSIFNYKTNDFRYVNSRSIDFEADALLMKQEVLKQENIIAGSGFRNENDIGLIVSSTMLREFGYPENANVIYGEYTYKDTATDKFILLKVPIPVRAIVNKLPGKYSVIYPSYFGWAWLRAVKSPFNINDKLKEVLYFLPDGDKESAKAIKDNIDVFFKNNNLYDSLQPEVVFNSDTLGFLPGYKIEISFWTPVPDKRSMDMLNEKIGQFLKSNHVDHQLQRYYNYESDIDENYVTPPADAISIYFTKLDRIRDFSAFLYKTYNSDKNSSAIQFDENTVKEKENFLFLSNVTKIIATLLVMFSTLAISLFIFNMLNSHLSRVKMNIGTFKALGLSDNVARNIYFSIIIYFIISGILISLILSGLTGNLLNTIMKRNFVVNKEVDYFKLLDWKTFFALFIIITSSLLISWYTIRRILNKTPGDLIYNR